MSWFRRLLQWVIKPAEVKRGYSPSVRYALEATPTVKFDALTLSKSVKADLRRNIEQLDDLRKKRVPQIYEVALGSVSAGRDLNVLFLALMKIEGMSKERAAEIARSLNNKATAIVNRERHTSLGITHAKWTYANAPCMRDPNHPSAAEVQRDAAHCAANGKKYEIRTGLFVDGKWTWPGVEEGCKCASRSILPGLEE